MIWILIWLLCGFSGMTIAYFFDENFYKTTRLEFLVCVVLGPISLIAMLYYWADSTEFWNKPLLKNRHD